MKPLLALSILLVATLVLWSTCNARELAKGGTGRPAASPATPAEHLHDAAFLEGYKRLGPRDRKVHDPVSVLAIEPNQEWTVAWPEHPDGRFTKRTNERGFVETEPTPLVARGRRILVLGDSHTEGVVGNEESFPNVLEARLRVRDAWLDVEVINAGVGYSGPYVYLGMLRKQLELAPDAVIATLFSGNDFWEDLLTSYLRAGERPPNPGAEYFESLGELKDVWSAAAWQGVNQVVRFRRFPEERARALATVIDSFERMQALCDEHGIRFVALLLPTKFDTDDVDPRRLQHMLGLLDLERDDLAANARLAAELRVELEARGIACIDATPALRAEPAPCYWSRDHHLNVTGHAVVAGLLEEHLLATW